MVFIYIRICCCFCMILVKIAEIFLGVELTNFKHRIGSTVNEIFPHQENKIDNSQYYEAVSLLQTSFRIMITSMNHDTSKNAPMSPLVLCTQTPWAWVCNLGKSCIFCLICPNAGRGKQGGRNTHNNNTALIPWSQIPTHRLLNKSFHYISSCTP